MPCKRMIQSIFSTVLKSIKIVESKEKVVAFPLLHKINE